MAKNCGLKKWVGRDVAVFFIKEDQKILTWKPWQKTLPPWMIILKSLSDVFEKRYGEHNTTPELKYTLISTAKELFVKFSKPNEDDSQGAIVSPSISSASKKYKNNLGIALNMPVLYHQLTQEKIPKTHAWVFSFLHFEQNPSVVFIENH